MVRRYSRITSLGKNFVFVRPKPLVLLSKDEEVVSQYHKEGGVSELKIGFQMMDTFDRIKYALRIKEWVCLLDTFQRFDKQLEEYMNVHGRASLLYARALVMLEEQLSTESVDKMEPRRRKRSMSDRDVEALNSIKEKLVKYKEQYQDLIRSFRETLAAPKDIDSEEEGEGECDSNADEKAEDHFRSLLEMTPTFSEGNQGEPWVKGDDEITWEQVEKEFWDIPYLQEERELGHMQELIGCATTPAQKLKFLFYVMKVQLNMNLTLSEPIPVQLWKSCVQNMFAALDILGHHYNICLSSTFMEMGPYIYETKKTAEYKGKIQVRADLVEFLTGIYFEFDISLKFILPDTQSYQERLKDECMLFILFDECLGYLYIRQDFTRAANVALLYMELVYFRSQAEYEDSLLNLVNLVDCGDSGEKMTDEDVETRRSTFPKDCTQLMDILVSIIDSHGDAAAKLQALLCGVYNHALIGNFSDAMRLLSSTNVEAKVQISGRSMKIHYNRAMAQLGLCAFRAGSIETSYRFLSELYACGKIEDLLAQHSETKMWEPMEQTPYHMRINLELLEAVHLICAMLVGNLKQAMMVHGTEGYLHPVMAAASKALGEGDFNISFNIIKSLDLWTPLENRDDVFKMLSTKIKETALRHYLVTCSLCYQHVRLNKLIDQFDLPVSETQRIVDSMMKELHASWDRSRIVFHKVGSGSRKQEASRFYDHV